MNHNDQIKLLFSLVLFVSLTGCGSVLYNTPPLSPKKLFDHETSIIQIKANGSWRSSGTIIQKGNKYKITATGRWRTGNPLLFPNLWVGADGIGSLEGTPVVKGFADATLIAKIGNNHPPFVVGNSFVFNAEHDGILFFRSNDVEWGLLDNEGQMEVKIKNITSNKQPVVKIDQLSKKATPNKTVSFANNWAIIIGISKYQNSSRNGLTNLLFADDDAKAFAQSLRNLGWNESHINLLINEEATQRNITIALESWLSKAGPNDQVILFWAGHGYPDPEYPEKVYFATYDTDIRIPATGYRMDRVRSALEEIGSKNVILFADTCHAGKLITRGEGNRGISIIPSIDKIQREQKIPKGWIFMVGADTDRQAIEHTSWTNGAFTHSLIKGLNGEADGFQSAGAKDGVVTMGELKDYMKTSMPDETQKVLGVAKHPVIATSTGDPDIWNLILQVTQ